MPSTVSLIDRLLLRVHRNVTVHGHAFDTNARTLELGCVANRLGQPVRLAIRPERRRAAERRWSTSTIRELQS
jgi:hypothetical protein